MWWHNRSGGVAASRDARQRGTRQGRMFLSSQYECKQAGGWNEAHNDGKCLFVFGAAGKRRQRRVTIHTAEWGGLRLRGWHRVQRVNPFRGTTGRV